MTNSTTNSTTDLGRPTGLGGLSLRATCAVAILTLAACGSGDSTSGQRPGAAAPSAPAARADTQRETPPVAVQAEAMPSAETAASDMPAQSQRCLDLIEQSRFGAALTVCQAALRADPGNTEVQAALERAKQETGQAATAAAGKAVEGATDAAAGAAKAAGEAAGSAKGAAQGAAEDELGTARGALPGSTE